MAYKIESSCVMCGACAADCPANAIKEGKTQYEIDTKLCVDCGNCEDICPVGAPVME